MLKKIIKIFNKKNICCLAIIVSLFFLFGHFSLAADLDTGIAQVGENTGLGDQDIRITIAKIIRNIIGFLGIIAVGLIMYAGWLYMSSGGNEEKLTKAKAVLRNAIIGLLIVLSSFAIAQFVLSKLMGATTGDFGGSTYQPGQGYAGGLSSLGSNIIESHYPARNAKEIARNTKIVVTFKEPIDPATIITAGKINKDNIKIFKTADGANASMIVDVSAYKTEDNKTFIFKPTQYLGSSLDKIWYSVGLGAGIKKGNGDAAFQGSTIGTAYEWSFEVGTFVDLTPPKIESIFPFPLSTEPRNAVVQINFTEAIDPISGSGATKNGFNNIVISDLATKEAIRGNFYISNQYQTIEFLTEDACGVNSCGNTIYCLPGEKKISALARAATLATISEAMAKFPFNGLVDMADNSLDGNKNGTAQGPESQSKLPAYNEDKPDSKTQGDDYIWSFSTNNTIDIKAPTVDDVKPSYSQGGVNLNMAPEALFNKILLSSSLTTNSVLLGTNNENVINYWISKSNNTVTKKTTVYINHDQFKENTNYYPEFKAGVKDIYQNCYSPCSGMGITGSPSCCNGSASAREKCR